LLPWRNIAVGDERPVATNGEESGRFQGFCFAFERLPASARPMQSLDAALSIQYRRLR
jgi:hypothetical protein